MAELGGVRTAAECVPQVVVKERVVTFLKKLFLIFNFFSVAGENMSFCVLWLGTVLLHQLLPRCRPQQCHPRVSRSAPGGWRVPGLRRQRAAPGVRSVEQVATEKFVIPESANGGGRSSARVCSVPLAEANRYHRGGTAWPVRQARRDSGTERLLLGQVLA